MQDAAPQAYSLWQDGRELLLLGLAVPRPHCVLPVDQKLAGRQQGNDVRSPPFEERFDLGFGSWSRGNLEVVNNVVVEITVAEVTVEFRPSVEVREGKAKLSAID